MNDPLDFDDPANGPAADTPDILSSTGGFDRLWARGTNVAEQWRHTSPDGAYEIVYYVCHTDVIPWTEIGMGEVIRQGDGKIMARLFRDHYTKPQFVWLPRETGPVLVWASTYLYGYEVLDFGTGTLRHVVEREGEDFIWTGVSLSPKQDLLAIDGCYWACPASIRILHVGERPLSLPFREITLFQRQDGAWQWTSDRTLQIFNHQGRVTWCGIIPPQFREATESLPVWRSSLQSGVLAGPFLSYKESQKVSPETCLDCADIVVIDVAATSPDEALHWYQEQTRSDNP